MIDLEDIRQHRPWILDAWAEHIGLGALTKDTILHALEQAQITWGDLSEADLATYKIGERRALLSFTPGPQLDSMFKRFESAIKAGNATEFGRLVSVSPFRFDATVVSLLSSKAKVTP